jgi:signal peptide peptidase SppA
MSNHQALSRIHGREAFVMPETADLFVSNLQQFARTDPEKSESLSKATRESVEFCYSVSPASEETRKPFIYQDGIAIIPIHGALLNRFPYSWGFVTGYQAIRRQMNAALEDDDVQLIVFDVDSPGGETAGCLELADEIRESRAKKPLLAVVDSLSCSAGYALASAATRMVATPSSKIGSIGVYIMHIDVSGAMDQAGIEITYIEAPKGGMKTAGSGYRKLDRKAAEYLQGFVDASYEEFVALVVANRGIEDADVRETEGRVFRSEEALALGLIDAVKTPTEAVSSFLAELGDDEPTESEDEDMTTESKTPAAAPEPPWSRRRLRSPPPLATFPSRPKLRLPSRRAKASRAPLRSIRPIISTAPCRRASSRKSARAAKARAAVRMRPSPTPRWPQRSSRITAPPPAANTSRRRKPAVINPLRRIGRLEQAGVEHGQAGRKRGRWHFHAGSALCW